jgi:hypothetical protein
MSALHREESRMSSVIAAPHITAVDPNREDFRTALDAAGPIVKGTPFTVYSAGLGEVLFEELVAPGELAMYPVPEAEAIRNGLPSCWSITCDGNVTALRYADRRLHAASGIDVTDPQFLMQLTQVAAAFADAGLHETLELNVAGYLFPPGNDQVTLETTDETSRRQIIRLIPMPDHIRTGKWGAAACFGFDADGRPHVMGLCAMSGPHDDKPPPPPPWAAQPN